MYPQLALILVLTGVVTSLNVDQCPGLNLKNLEDRVKVSGCREPPCVLRKGKKYEIEMSFKPEHDIQEVTDNVKAIIRNVPFPFFGVDGQNVCDKIYFASDPTKKASCPLKGHTEYIYKNSFPVLPIYPAISYFNVQWALITELKSILVCFSLPAKIR